MNIVHYIIMLFFMTGEKVKRMKTVNHILTRLNSMYIFVFLLKTFIYFFFLP